MAKPQLANRLLFERRVNKPQPDRFLCFFCKGKKIVVTNAFEKKQDKLPVSEKQRALGIKKNYEKRVEEGIYYGK